MFLHFSYRTKYNRQPFFVLFCSCRSPNCLHRGKKLANYLQLEYKVKTKCNLPTSLKLKTSSGEQMELVFIDEMPYRVSPCDDESSNICFFFQYQTVLLLLRVCMSIWVVVYCICFLLNVQHWIIFWFSISIKQSALTNSLPTLM